MLRTSHRFGQNSGIGQLAQAVNVGAPATVRQVLSQNPHELTHITLAPHTHAPWRRLVVHGQPDRDAVQSDHATAPAGYAHYLKVLQQQRPPLPATPEALNQWAAAVLKAHSQFQLLCAVRRGPWGVEKLNEQIAQCLHQEGLISAASGWYEGRPVLVTRNDAELGLMNGDIGITLRYPRGDGADMLRVAFISSDGSDGIHWVQPSRLTAVETVYALTVHKSQGSEFKHTALIMPDQLSPVLTQELIYTGITRAQQWFTLIETGPASVLDDAVMRQTLRFGGMYGM
jgi:exodeoxyribonuclease V alpha subunit